MTTDLSEEDKARILNEKITAPLVWGHSTRGVRVEDLQEHRFDEATTILKDHFLNSEITYKMLNVLDDEESVEEFLATCKSLMKDRVSIVAIKEKTDEAIGLVLMRVIDKLLFSRTFSRLKIRQGGTFNKIMDYYKAVETPVNLHDLYEIRKYMKIYGIVLLPKYREKGLETLMLKCAVRCARACSVMAIAGVFPSGHCQEWASGVGFQTLNTIFYQKYSVNGQRVFLDPGSHNYGASFMAMRIPEHEEQEG